MTSVSLTEGLKKDLIKFLKTTKQPELVSSYLFYIEKKHKVSPILYPKEKKIYRGLDQLIEKLEKDGNLWHKTEIKIQFDKQSVNERTKKIYICPFTGKVFGDNTCPNPQDAIYDWVERCPENKERSGGLRSKRFFVSDDKEVIKNYITKRKEPITKTVYSSAVSGKLFNSKKAVVDDFIKNYTKTLSFLEVQNQNRFEIEETFMNFIQEQLTEEKITAFVEMLAEYEEFSTYVANWTEEE